MSNQISFTFADVEDYLDNLVTNGVVTKQARGRFVSKVLREVKTITELRSPNRDAFIKAHNAVADGTLDVWDKVVSHLYEVEQAELAKRNAEQDAIIAANKRKAEMAELEATINPTFTLQQLKSLTAMMDLCALATIDLRRINEFFMAVGVTILPTAEKASA